MAYEHRLYTTQHDANFAVINSRVLECGVHVRWERVGGGWGSW